MSATSSGAHAPATNANAVATDGAPADTEPFVRPGAIPGAGRHTCQGQRQDHGQHPRLQALRDPHRALLGEPGHQHPDERSQHDGRQQREPDRDGDVHGGARLLARPPDQREAAESPRRRADRRRSQGRTRIAVLYRARKLLGHDLLRVARVESRAGRPINHYQASARRFIVPYAASRAASAAEFVEQVDGAPPYLLRLGFVKLRE